MGGGRAEFIARHRLYFRSKEFHFKERLLWESSLSHHIHRTPLRLGKPPSPPRGSQKPKEVLFAQKPSFFRPDGRKGGKTEKERKILRLKSRRRERGALTDQKIILEKRTKKIRERKISRWMRNEFPVHHE